MKKMTKYIGIAIASIFMTSAVSAGPSMYSHYIPLKPGITVKQCMERGVALLNELKFTQMSQVQGDNMIFAENTEYTVHFRCVADAPRQEGALVIIIAGPESSVAEQVGNAIAKIY